MIAFNPMNHPISASSSRIVSLWFGDVDRLSLILNNYFTGSAVAAAVMTLSGKYAYYIVFLSLSQSAIEMWSVSPEEIDITEAPAFEKNLRDELAGRGIVLSPLFSDTPNYNVILSRIPFAYDTGNETMQANAFEASNSEHSSVTLNKNDKLLIRKFFRLA